MQQKQSYAGIDETTLKRETGKSWEDWFAILDEAHGGHMEEEQVKHFLAEYFDLPESWLQKIAEGYAERKRSSK